MKASSSSSLFLWSSECRWIKSILVDIVITFVIITVVINRSKTSPVSVANALVTPSPLDALCKKSTTTTGPTGLRTIASSLRISDDRRSSSLTQLQSTSTSTALSISETDSLLDSVSVDPQSIHQAVLGPSSAQPKGTATNTNIPKPFLIILSLNWPTSSLTTSSSSSSSSSLPKSTSPPSFTSTSSAEPARETTCYYSQHVADIWKWKDTCLGDGRDFFETKPKTLASLSKYILQHTNGNGSNSTRTTTTSSSIDPTPTSSTTTSTSATQQLSSTPSSSYHLQECCILSNCARFDVLCVVSPCSPSLASPSTHPPDSYDSSRHLDDERGHFIKYTEQQIKIDVSRCISTQVMFGLHGTSDDSKDDIGGSWIRNNPFSSIFSTISKSFQKTNRNRMDRPESVLTSQPPLPYTDTSPSLLSPSSPQRQINELIDHWTVIQGTQSTLDYLSQVAAGMACRPKYPSRPVIFRPFSSRDQHILLQLKRTRDVALTVGSSSSRNRDDHDDDDVADADNVVDKSASEIQIGTGGHPKRRLYLPLVLEYALRAGKAARNPNVVKSIGWLRDTYGTGDSSRTSSQVPNDVSNSVAKDAYEQAIQPLIEEGTTKIDWMLEEQQQYRYEQYRQEFFLRDGGSKLNITTFGIGDSNADSMKKNPISQILYLRQHMNDWVDRKLVEHQGDDSLHTQDRTLVIKARQLLNRKLHGPTTELRNHGTLKDFETVDDCIVSLQTELQEELNFDRLPIDG